MEIGPGLGALTSPLLKQSGRLEVIELDRDLIPRIRQSCHDLGELVVYNEDALNFDFSRLCQNPRQLRVIGNLPYNISTPLLFHLLDQIGLIRDMHFMLQKEVVERLAAGPNGVAYGRLSVMVQYRCRVEPLFVIGPDAFRPPPRVDSAFVRLVPHEQPPFNVADERSFATVVRQAFSQRRKTVRNSLGGLLSADIITTAGIDPGARPESLAPADFAALSNCLR